MTAVAPASPAARPQHVDRALTAVDGTTIAFRDTAPHGAAAGTFVFEMGTLGKPAAFDLMADELAKSGIRSYAVQSRDGHEVLRPGVDTTLGFRRHADDLDRVFTAALAENPHVPAAVGGSSLGASIAMHWNVTRNAGHVPVVALNPVFLDRFVPLGDRLKIVGSLASRRVAAMDINSPMSLGIPIASNPRSTELRFAHPERMKITAGLYGDLLAMTAPVLAHGRRSKAPLLVAMAGDDRVARNGVTRALAPLLASGDHRTVMTVAGAAHDLSQAADKPALVQAIAGMVLRRAAR